MSHELYSADKLYKIGRENYEKLVLYCMEIERAGLWNQARTVMKQSCTQVLDLYVQSILLSMAVHCGAVGQVEREYILSVTDINSLDIPREQEVGQDIIAYGQKTAKMPPILLQLCGVYDQKGRDKIASYFMDAVINIMLCQLYLSDNESKATEYMEEFFNKTVAFLQLSEQGERVSASYIYRKLGSDTIRCEAAWLTEQKETEQSPLECELFFEEEVCVPVEEETQATEQGNTSTKVMSGVEAVQKENEKKKKKQEQEESKRRQKIEEARQEMERLRLEEEQERLAAEQRRIEDEKRRLEEEQRQAKEEFQKVKKRLQERERAEREAQEKRIADLLAELNSLVGLEKVKEEIQSLINLIKVRKMREKLQMPMMDMSYHMVFTGSPGTGKTTVARLVARIYKELGILTEGNLVETDRSRLVAGYVGQTAINVREIVEQAIGGVLFIDEAYALVSPDTANDFGSEAVDTLVKLMEDHRDNLVVIVAGYTEEMKVFLRSNTGLISRFNKFISFDDYSEKQLLDILEVMVEKAGLVIEEEAVAAVGKTLHGMTEDEKKDFGNARGVRNLFEKMVMNQANRLVMMEDPDRGQLMLLTQEDAVFA